ncbi:hypothetical protein FACS1894202_14500 [Clostridia bacterium]|nr:hypothetical protein FACS1894202_14500 [Clostridia bacterium]GHU96152.1 hypothetical protein FACS1894208_10290 [Clostridia bacterium]
MSKLPERLKELRGERKITQQDIANMLNVNRVTYTCWESGKHEPDLEQLITLSQYFKVSLDYLAGRVN